MKNQIIIGMCGYPNAGKTTVSNYLSKKYNFYKASFAKNLKEMCKYAFNLNDYDVYDQKGKEVVNESFQLATYDEICRLIEWINRTHDLKKQSFQKIFDTLMGPIQKTPRKLLQLIGTEICRDIISETYHIDVVKMEIQNKPRVVFDDARFPNEFELCTHKILIRRIDSTYVPSHSSDKLLSDSEYDYVVEAKSGEIEKIINQIEDFIKRGL